MTGFPGDLFLFLLRVALEADRDFSELDDAMHGTCREASYILSKETVHARGCVMDGRIRMFAWG